MDSSEESNSIPQSEILYPTALHFPVNDNENAEKSHTKLPLRLRQRLLKSKSSTPTAQDIETKLNEAQVRRQQFYELLSCKARSLHHEGSGQQLDTKPLAAEQKRYWRRTTASLAKAYTSLGINEKSVKVMPFEQLAPHLNSTATVQTAKALLNQIEIQINMGQSIIDPNKFSMLENIDHLLKHVSTFPGKGVTLSKTSKNRGVKGVDSEEVLMHSIMLPRYPVRVVLCAYMILGHPSVVFSGKVESERTLVESAMTFIREFELLISILLEGPIICSTEKNVSSIQCPRSFRSQLENFDKSWCSYLYCFVMWKVKDIKLMEEDLIRAACVLEVKKIKMINKSSDRDCFDFEPEIKAFQEKEAQIQKLLQANMQHLSGNAGVERMEHALSDIRSHPIGTKAENSLTSLVTNFLSQNSAQSSQIAETSSSRDDEIQNIQDIQGLFC